MRALWIVLLLTGCYSAAMIREFPVWISFPVKGADTDVIECIADRFEADGAIVTSRRSSAVVFVKAGLLAPELETLYTIDIRNGIVEIRKRDDMIFPNRAKAEVQKTVAPCM
jgi:hypothetical protein